MVIRMGIALTTIKRLSGGRLNPCKLNQEEQEGIFPFDSPSILVILYYT